MWETKASVGREKDSVGNEMDDVGNAKDLSTRALRNKC